MVIVTSVGTGKAEVKGCCIARKEYVHLLLGPTGVPDTFMMKIIGVKIKEMSWWVYYRPPTS